MMTLIFVAVLMYNYMMYVLRYINSEFYIYMFMLNLQRTFNIWPDM